jgi:copper chaperone NosL
MSAVTTPQGTPGVLTLRESLVGRRARDRRDRWAVVGLAVVGALLFAGSYWLPWWNFHLVAPQYPLGLDVRIALSGVSGAVAEIDILNHYIGMQSLSAAAAPERAAAGWLVSVVVLAVAAALISAGRKLGWLALVPAIGLPLGFVLDTTWWMWHFGHDLDPHAPITFPVFTPVLVGPGTIGQFHTWAWPASGFWVALAGLAVVIAAEVVRRRVCRECPVASACGATCPRHMVGPERPS